MALSEEGWLKELKDTSPANEAEGQTTTSDSHTKIAGEQARLPNFDKERASADVDVDLEICTIFEGDV